MKLQPPRQLHISAYLLCAALLGGCGSRLTESVKATTEFHRTQSRMASLQQPPSSALSTYGVPEARHVEFDPHAQSPVQDLTY